MHVSGGIIDSMLLRFEKNHQKGTGMS